MELSDRAKEINEKILEILRTSNPSDPNYITKIRAAKELYAELNKEIQIASNTAYDEEKLAFEASKFEREEAIKAQERELKEKELRQQKEISDADREFKEKELKQRAEMAEEERELKAKEMEQQSSIAEKQAVLKIVEIAAGLTSFAVGAVISIWMYGRSSAKEHGEFPETYDTLTDRTIVQHGLRLPFKSWK